MPKFHDGRVDNTFCPRLWGEAFVDLDGTVFPCCDRPGPGLGDIYERSLSEIMEGEEIQRMRSMSLDGRLRCFADCRRLDKSHPLQPPFSVANRGGYARRVKLLIGRACNIACVMCPQEHDDLKCLDFHRLIDAINFEDVERIDIQGGEPLAIEATRELLAYLTRLEGRRVVLLTNGLLLDDDAIDFVLKSSPFIHISLNAATKETHEKVNRGSSWETVIENLARLRRRRKEAGSNLVILGHMTIIPQNIHETPDFIRMHPQLGFDAIDFSYDHRVPAFLARQPWRKRKLISDVADAIQAAAMPSQDLKCRLERVGFQPIVSSAPLQQLGLHP